MLCIPIRRKDPRTSYLLLLVLEANQIERLKEHDPAHFVPAKLPAPWNTMKLDGVVIGYEDPSGMEVVRKLVEAGDKYKALEYVSRGFKYRPELGDSDGAYKDAKPEAGA